MEIQKTLDQIAWNVPEQVYRDDPALSYSTLSRFEKEGFDRLDHLFDKIESPALTQGSVVDTLLTGGVNEFNERFIVRDIKISDSGIAICKKLSEMPTPYPRFGDIPERIVSDVAKEVGFWESDKWDKKRYSEVLKTGDVADYYLTLLNADKVVVSTDMYNEALVMVKTLRESPTTCGYFAEDDPFSPVKRYYQLKFKAKFSNVVYRSMMDLLCVDYEKKVIYPIDLKTSGKSEWHFEDSFRQFKYMIQARLYWRVLRANLDNDPYFKDFELKDFKFIVINKFTLTPLIWEFPLTQVKGTLTDEDGNQYRDPFEIGEELQGYLNCKPLVPNGINKDGVNIIKCLRYDGEGSGKDS